MSDYCSFCRPLVTSVVYLGFLFGFYNLGHQPLMCFFAASAALIFAEWTRLINFSVFSMLVTGVMAGSVACLLYYVHVFSQLDPALAFYPLYIVWLHDAVSFVVGQVWGRVRISPDLEGKTTVLGFLAGVATLIAANGYILNHNNPVSIMHFPVTYFGLFGFAVLSSILILLGRIVVHSTAFGVGAQKEEQAYPGLGFLELYSSHLFFAYFVALISFGRDLFWKVVPMV